MRALLVPLRVCTRTLHLPRLVWNVFMRASCATLHHASRPFSPSSIVSNYRHKKKKQKRVLCPVTPPGLPLSSAMCVPQPPNNRTQNLSPSPLPHCPDPMPFYYPFYRLPTPRCDACRARRPSFVLKSVKLGLVTGAANGGCHNRNLLLLFITRCYFLDFFLSF